MNENADVVQTVQDKNTQPEEHKLANDKSKHSTYIEYLKQNKIYIIGWSFFIYGFFCFFLALLKSDNPESSLWFTCISGISFAVWLLVVFGSDNSGHILMNILGSFVFIVLEVSAFVWSLSTLLAWSSSPIFIIIAFILLLLCSTGVCLVFSAIYSMFKRIFEKIRFLTSFLFQGNESFLKNFIAFIGAIATLLTPVASIIASLSKIWAN